MSGGDPLQSMSSPGSPMTQAFMVSGTAKSLLVLTPAGAYIEILLPLSFSFLSLGSEAQALAALACTFGACASGSPSSAESARAAETTCSRISARCSSFVRIDGAEDEMAPTTAPL